MMKNIFGIITLLVLCPLGIYGQADAEVRGKELFGDLTARHIGPALMSGRINDLELHPTNAKVVYLGAAGGGVWKSNDGGATFNPIFDEYCQSIGTVTLDPSDPDNTIYVGTGETWTRNSVSVGCGLYRSVDGGANWELLGFGDSERIASVIVHPENPDEIYVGVLGALWGDSEERGVFKSSDRGKTWKKMLYIDPRTGCADLAIDPSDPSVMYASMWEFRRTGWSFESGGANSALYKSTDGGETWKKIHKGFPSGSLGRLGIAVAPSNPKVLYTVIEAQENDRKGLYRSDDAGESWKQLNNDFGITVRPFYFSRIVVDPRNEDVVVKAGLTGSISRDGGKTFKNLGNMHSDIHDIAFHIKDPEMMFAGTDGGVYRSWDGGNTMEIVENLPLSQFYHVSTDNAEPYNVYGGLQDNGSWYGPSRSPGGITARDWNPVGGGDGFRMFRHPSENIIYAEMQGAENIWRYDADRNLVKTIQPLPVEEGMKLRFNWNAPIALSPHVDDRIYVGSQFLHRSDNMGDTWEIISPDLTTNDPAKQNQAESGGLSVDNSGAENHTTIFTIAESPLDENVIWVGTDDGNVQVTRDGGKSWSNTVMNIEGLPANTWCYHIEAGNFDAGTAYAVFDGHTMNDQNPYVFKTNDFGKSWKSITTPDIKGFARNIQEDYENPDLLFLGTEFGLYITTDGGSTWNKFTNNMPAVAVHFIDLHPATNDLVMGTHGRGVIIIDDISPLRELSEEVVAKDVHFFSIPPTVIDETTGFSDSFGSETQFVGRNDSRDVQIRYYLKKRHVFGKMAMEIQDMDGNKIAELGAGKSKGINIVTWNYSRKQPKMAKGKTFSFGGFTTPKVPPGTYKVVMTKGNEVYEQPFELLFDNDLPLSREDYAVKNEVTMELYQMSQELAYMVYELDELIAVAEKNGNKKETERLNSLKEDLVITTGDNYVGAAEPQLRERISALYSKVASSYDKPSDNDMENLGMLKRQMEEAEQRLTKLKKKSKGLEGVELQSYSEFIGS
ncbi:VPS10 domain-containing protein [Robertkochia flava]|uniref:VPS10 domain-containing protein n=1 Tax=Robertkochia flava TaxID=3447986 RepID=UPI001CCC9CA4|nr:hypothetical protein [Robertkochia marina]